MFSKTFALASLASVASAHMLISNPIPYGKSNLNNSPLDASGSDYPCKLRSGTYDLQGASNVYAAGSTQKLSFLGTAVHGGGSCQISITTDTEPNSKSTFKVIKSIEGGCPAKGQSGNMGDSASAVDPYTYDYTIPSDLAAGNYTIAWTWFNKVGNREMYMNCAPLTVTGSGGSKSALDSLPDMFVANIGNNCGTPSDKDIVFPNPGSDVDKFNGNTDAFAAPTGTGCQTGSGSGSGSGSTATATGSTPTTTAAPGSGNGSGTGASTSVPGGVFITVSNEPATTKAPVATTPVATTAAPAATTSASSGGGSGSGSGSGSSYSVGTACTNEGEWNCINGSSFQRCASGAWTAPQGLSSGVTCTPGQSSDMALSAKRGLSKMRRAFRMKEIV